MNLYIETTGKNKTQNCIFYADEVTETQFNAVGNLFNSLQKEYGKCISKMYIGDHNQIGWVFEKRIKYNDCDEYYIQETWVSVLNHEPEITKTYDYHSFK